MDVRAWEVACTSGTMSYCLTRDWVLLIALRFQNVPPTRFLVDCLADHFPAVDVFAFARFLLVLILHVF